MRRLTWGLVLAVVGLAPGAAAQETVEYYHVDALGSVRAVMNQDGAVVRRHDYFPFGEEYLTQSGADARRFTGKARDAETGLDYFGARYYASRAGRFTSVDPGNASAAVDDPQSWNAYAYARNNPLRFVDPDGRRWFARNGNAVWVAANKDGTYTSPGDGWVELDPKNYDYRMNVAFVAGTLSRIGEDSAGRKMLAPWMSPEQGLEDTTFSLAGNLWLAGAAVRAGAVAFSGGRTTLTELAFTTAKDARVINMATNLTARQFQNNLLAAGYQVVKQEMTKNGMATILSNGQKVYTIYSATSGGASVQVATTAGIKLSKIRLGGF